MRRARQPEADSKISKNLLLGCALAEATAIYGMVVAILTHFPLQIKKQKEEILFLEGGFQDAEN